MLNLYWKSGGRTRNLIEKPFSSEAEFEKYVFDNQDILGDIYILHRQVRTGSKQGIPDMLGVDQDARVCIVELKNQEAGEDILPQVLGYAIWAETNPDSIKAIWLETRERPEDIEIAWDNLDIRVILIAPSFKSTLPRMAGKIGYPIDLIQVRRYCFEEEEFLLVEALEEKQPPKVGVTRVKGAWDWDFYESEHGKDATAQFRKAVDAVAALVARQDWDLSCNLNKHYTGFKLGNKVVMSVHWGSTYTWNLRLKLPQGVADDLKGEHWEFQRYSHNFNEVVLRPLHPDSPAVDELEPLLIRTYKHVSGTE